MSLVWTGSCGPPTLALPLKGATGFTQIDSVGLGIMIQGDLDSDSRG